MCRRIADFLQLTNPETFTAHCLRRSAATLMANAGVSQINLKKFGRWKSDSVAMGYIDESATSKRKLAQTLRDGEEVRNVKKSAVIEENESNQPKNSLIFSGCTFYKCDIDINKKE